MNYNVVNKNDEMVMALIHYFITEENYSPIVVKGVKDEIWLENLDGPYRIIRINSNYIHNEEQYKFDVFKISKIVEQIRKKTLSFNIKTLNILLNVSDRVEIKENKNIFSVHYHGLDEITEDQNILEIFPEIKNKLIKDKEGIDLIVNVTNDINAKTMKDNKVYDEIFKPKKIIITPLLIAICIIMFFLMYILGNGSENIETLLLFGANYKPFIQMGQVWRLVSSIFLHIGVIHLFVNMYALFVIGRQLESLIGRWKYLIIFMGSGMIGSLFSVVLHTSVSAGASGAIFGLLGSLLYFGYHYRLYLGTVLKTQIIPVIFLNLLIGFVLPGIDNYAHIGGLVGGYLLTMILGVPGKTKTSDRVNGLCVLILLIAFLSFMLWRY